MGKVFVIKEKLQKNAKFTLTRKISTFTVHAWNCFIHVFAKYNWKRVSYMPTWFLFFLHDNPPYSQCCILIFWNKCTKYMNTWINMVHFKWITLTWIQWWFVNLDTFVPGWYFRINEFSGLLKRPSVQKRKSVPAFFGWLARFLDYRSPDLRIITVVILK